MAEDFMWASLLAPGVVSLLASGWDFFSACLGCALFLASGCVFLFLFFPFILGVGFKI
jgi:hypothetical protein